jgi:CheY-like chemotaxis protein
VESQLGKGTAFYLLFPLSDNIVENPPRKEKPFTLPPGDHRILIVDDEAIVLKYCRDMVESLGFSVIAANSGKDAVRIYEQEKDRIDLVILDMIMPEMDGLKTYYALKAANKDVNVIISTGYTLDDRAEKALADGCQYLRKPYTRNELAAAITTIIALGKKRTPVPN